MVVAFAFFAKAFVRRIQFPGDEHLDRAFYIGFTGINGFRAGCIDNFQRPAPHTSAYNVFYVAEDGAEIVGVSAAFLMTVGVRIRPVFDQYFPFTADFVYGELGTPAEMTGDSAAVVGG
jgi:hypothetical protein